MIDLMKLSFNFDSDHLKNLLVDSIFPRTCPVCDGIVMPRGQLICRECMKRLNFIREPVCEKCGKQILTEDQKLCYNCAHGGYDFDCNRSVLNYDKVSQKIMVGIKYKNRREHADFIGRLAAWKLGSYIEEIQPECIVPVPVHESRLKARGYNQAELIADVLGYNSGVPVRTDLIIRCKHTKALKDLDGKARRENLKEAFIAGNVTDFPQSVLIFDDIYTTGATLDTCSRVLRAAGVQRVYCAAICSSSDV